MVCATMYHTIPYHTILCTSINSLVSMVPYHQKYHTRMVPYSARGKVLYSSPLALYRERDYAVLRWQPRIGGKIGTCMYLLICYLFAPTMGRAATGITMRKSWSTVVLIFSKKLASDVWRALSVNSLCRNIIQLCYLNATCCKTTTKGKRLRWISFVGVVQKFTNEATNWKLDQFR